MDEMSSNKISQGESLVDCEEDVHLGRIIFKNLKKWKNGVHQVELSSDDMDTNEDVRIKSVRVARRLQDRELGIGDLIIICGDTHNFICLPILASFFIGSKVLGLSTTLTITEVKRMLSLEKPKIIFCDPRMKNIFTEASKELEFENIEIVIFNDDFTQLSTKGITITSFNAFLQPTSDEDSFEVVDFDPSTTVATITCSSGTTGFPKGVCVTHEGLARSVYYLFKSKYNTAFFGSGFMFNFSNYYWISAMWFLLYTCFSGTPRLGCAKPFSVDLLLKGLKNYKSQILFLSPVALYDTVKSSLFDDIDLTSVKNIFVGGSYIAPNIIQRIKDKLVDGAVYQGYGCSEAGMVTLLNVEEKLDSIGKVLPWVNWKVVNIETNAEVNVKEKGELCVQTKTLFKCYLNNPVATTQTFDQDGFYRTGDLVSYDEEGFLYFIDRVKEVIKYRNYQITPAEIEYEITKLPDVHQVCVVGIKDEKEGEIPMAFVQKKDGSKLTEDDVKNTVKSKLADHKQLRGGVKFLTKIPETTTGKVDRKLLKEMAQNLNKS